MKTDQYIKEATRTESMDLFKVDYPRLLHAALGVTTEFCELAIGVNANDQINVKEETGDVLWYIAIAADEMDVSFEDLISISTFSKAQMIADPGHAAMTFLSELNDVVKRACFYGVEFDTAKFGAHLGNVLIFLLLAGEEDGVTLEEAMDANIAKLRKRYPNKFTTEAAVNRDLASEREVLEQ